MKLYHSPTSPYVRKILVLMAETGDARRKVWQFVIFAASKINRLARGDVGRFGSKRLKAVVLRLI